MNYKESLEYISSVSWKGSRPGLERITRLMKLLGNPQDQLKFIHIGGTNGKGSTAAFLSNILRRAGYKTGLFISPFIERFNERMQINNECISDEELAQITTFVKPYSDSMEDAPTEFELITAIAFIYFINNNCDIVVLEVGMGGEFDATNIINAPELAILTSIGLDHMDYLGDTIEKIAQTKAGIIKENCDVVLYKQSEEVQAVIEARCREQGARLYISEPEELKLTDADIFHQTFASPYGELTVTLPAQYQKNNLAAVLKSVEVLRNKNYTISSRNITDGLLDTRWPGRFEILRERPLFIADGAHNPQGMEAAVKSLKALFPGKKIILLLGILSDKDYRQMLDMILPLAKAVVCTSPPSPRALSAQMLKTEVMKRADVDAVAAENIRDAVNAALRTAAPEDIICAIGSLYMIGEIKTSLKNGDRK